jgi:hypothetical protein
MHLAVIYNSTGVTSGTLVTFDTIAQQGTNFSVVSAGTIAVANSGMYEINVSFPVLNVSGGTVGTQRMNVSAGTLLAASVTVDYGTQDNMVTLFGYWQAPAAGHFNVTSSITYVGGGLTIGAGRANMTMRRIG